MNRARLMKTVILPLLLAALATVGLYQTLANRPTDPAGPAVETVRVVVATRSIPPLTVLTAEMVDVREVPAAYAISGSLYSTDACLGRVAMVPLALGEVVLTSKISTQQAASASLSFAIRPGKRAMTVQVDEISGVAAFPRPGDHVDLLVTFRPLPQPSGSTDPVEQRTRLLMEGVAVLAVVQEFSAPNDATPREIKGYTSLTLEVTPEQGAIIAAAEAQGWLRYMLRPTLDDTMVGQFDISNVELQREGATLDTHVARRVRFEVRLLEIDVAALSGLGYRLAGTSVNGLTASQAASISGLVLQNQAKVLHTAVTNTSNRTMVSVGFGGEFRAADEAGTHLIPYGLDVWLCPLDYGQPTMVVDSRLSLTVVDSRTAGFPASSTISVAAAERLGAGEVLMVLGLASAEDFAAAAAGTRHLLPLDLVTEPLASGERILVVLIAPSL